MHSSAAFPTEVEVMVDDKALGHEWGGVALIESEVVHRLHLVPEVRRVPESLHLYVHRHMMLRC